MSDQTDTFVTVAGVAEEAAPVSKPGYITLSDGREIRVRRLLHNDLGAIMQALPAFSALDKVFKVMKEIEGGVEQPMPEIDDKTLWPLFVLEAKMTGLDAQEISELPLEDGITLMEEVGRVIPKFMKARKKN